MKNITSVKKEDCFGCTACKAVCKLDAISMVTDDEGFMYPIVDEHKCVECGACLHVCPALHRWKAEQCDNEYYAFQNQDQYVLSKSTSGGAFSALVHSVKEPYVCGCVLDDRLYVKHILSNRSDDIEAMRGSKYVQSDMGDCFSQIKAKLAAGEQVIFTGTSCQVHGLLNYLKFFKVATDRLITVDLICHGVPSNLMHQEYVKFYEKTKGVKRGTHYFRTKRQGWGMRFILKNHEQMFVHGEQTFVHSTPSGDYTSQESQLYLNIFFSDLCLRSACYHCPYCTENKPGDLTLADFWGIEETDLSLDFPKGCSLVIARGKGIHMLENILHGLHLNKEQIKVAKKYQLHLRRPVKCPDKRDAFWADYHRKGFQYVAHKYLRYGGKYKVIMLLYNIANRMTNKRIAQKLGSKLFY